MANLRALQYEPGQKLLKATAHADLTKDLLYGLDTATNMLTALPAAGDSLCGVPKVAAKSGQPVTLETDGILMVTAAAAITVGQPLKVTAAGKVTPATVGTDHVIGSALMPASADGDKLSMLKL